MKQLVFETEQHLNIFNRKHHMKEVVSDSKHIDIRVELDVFYNSETIIEGKQQWTKRA